MLFYIVNLLNDNDIHCETKIAVSSLSSTLYNLVPVHDMMGEVTHQILLAIVMLTLESLCSPLTGLDEQNLTRLHSTHMIEEATDL